jgi:CBS domain-containing protein
MAKTISIGELMTEKLKTIDLVSTAQEASKKMRDNKISSLVVVDNKNNNDNNNKPIGIVTERDLVRKVCVNDASSSKTLIKDIMCSPLVTIDSRSSVEVAADIMTQNKVRHLLVVEKEEEENNNTDEEVNRLLGIITPSDFVGYLKENLNIDDVNAKILESLKEQREEEQVVIEELEQQGELPEDSERGGKEYEYERPRQG